MGNIIHSDVNCKVAELQSQLDASNFKSRRLSIGIAEIERENKKNIKLINSQRRTVQNLNTYIHDMQRNIRNIDTKNIVKDYMSSHNIQSLDDSFEVTLLDNFSYFMLTKMINIILS